MKQLCSHRLSLVSLVIGVVFGCCLISLFQDASLISQSFRSHIKVSYEIADDAYRRFVSTNSTRPSGLFSVNPDEDGKLYDKVRVLCWVLTSPSNHKTKAKSVKETWGKRCNILLFMSTEEDASLPAVKLTVQEGRQWLWGKTREAFRHVWNNYRDQVDWFFKADDDTYAIVENLRYFLSAYNTSQPMWFGYKFNAIVEKGYFSGGAGYVLSKEATRRFVEEGYYDAINCRHDHNTAAEDAEMGKCMKSLNVSAMDTRDSKGRGRFFPFVPQDHIITGKVDKSYWYWKNLYYPVKSGLDCCSDSAIAFHYVDEKQMYLMEYLLYQLRPYGTEAESRPATPEPPPDLNLTATPWSFPDEDTNDTTTAVTVS